MPLGSGELCFRLLHRYFYVHGVYVGMELPLLQTVNSILAKLSLLVFPNNAGVTCYVLMVFS